MVGFYLSEENMNELYVSNILHTAILCLKPSVVSLQMRWKNSTANMMTAYVQRSGFGSWMASLMKFGGIENLITADKDKTFNRSRNMEEMYLK